MKKKAYLLTILYCFCSLSLFSQNFVQPDSSLLNGIKFRNIGPALASGRIADIAVNPRNFYEYYVAVASGNIWKTSNNGATWKPIFENYGAYSIACLALDVNNPNVIWAGTGENNSQRALGYGDGVYKSLDGGDTWKNVGLKNSRQIGKILINPKNSEIVYVAAEGSVWGSGGERGLYKTKNGGVTWKKVLNISEHTGVSDIELDPGNPDIIYAASHQRRRSGFTKINGGPESTIQKSTDGGKTWKKITKGLPNVHLGAIGIAVSKVNPDYIYAIVEAADEKSGFFRSINRGEKWTKMSNYVASSPQYYNEIFCDPKDVDKVYSVDTYSRVSLDGGKTWKKFTTKTRHVDDHALWINPRHTNNILIGGDGGIYESFDGGKSWYFKSNLPVTQFYRVAVDNSSPFYNIYGGTQDNNTLGGPSRNLTNNGVTNSEWFVTLGGDGFWVAVDPKNPNIVYCEYQYGNAYRYNKANGEKVFIKPQERKGELTYKWNWDAPLIMSPHSNTRLYMAANKVFMSEDKGNSWEVISEDLTSKTDRNKFKVMGKYWSSDAVAKDVSTSLWGTIVSLAESRVKQGLLFAGTDDGIIQLSEDNGKNWNAISSFPDIPKYTYVSDILPSKFDENIVYATFNNHKSDDFKPYVMKSKDKGKSWRSISANLPKNGSVYTIEQDHIDKNILFCGTEFGAYISNNGGQSWVAMKNGLPTIAVRDIAIQERESDLVLATFGRGFYVLDDYSPLRNISKISGTAKAAILPIRNSYLYVPKNKRKYFGDSYYIAPNPPYGATFTYYLKDEVLSSEQLRKKKEKDIFKKSEKINVSSWNELRKENLEESPYLLFVVEDEAGNIIRKIPEKPKKGLNRISWDLKYPTLQPVASNLKKYDPFKKPKGSIYSLPGKYTISLYLSQKGELEKLTEKEEFEVLPLSSSGFTALNSKQDMEIRKQIRGISNEIFKFKQSLEIFSKKLQQKKQSNAEGLDFNPEINKELVAIENALDVIDFKLSGHRAKASGEEIPPSEVHIMKRLYFTITSLVSSLEPLNSSQIEGFNMVKEAFELLKEEFKKVESHFEKIQA